MRTTPNGPLVCPQDLAEGDFTATAPNRLWNADVTHVGTSAGFVCLASVVDMFDCRFVGWRPSRSLRTDLGLDALQQAIIWACLDDAPDREVCHFGAGSQYLLVRYTERLDDAGIEPSVESVSNSYDDAFAELVIGLDEIEPVQMQGQRCNHDEVEYATLEDVDRLNNRSLLEPNGNISPAESGADHHSQNSSGEDAELTKPSLR